MVVASNGGADTDPWWLHNVRAHPTVEVQIGRDRWHGSVRIMLPDHPEYAPLWERANTVNRNRYDEYSAKTSRRIPIVVISPSTSRFEHRSVRVPSGA